MKTLRSLVILSVAALALLVSSVSSAAPALPNDECAIVKVDQAKGWSVGKLGSKAWSVSRPGSWSDGSRFTGARGLLARSVKPSCGNGGQTPCNTWVYIGNGYWMYRPC